MYSTSQPLAFQEKQKDLRHRGKSLSTEYERRQPLSGVPPQIPCQHSNFPRIGWAKQSSSRALPPASDAPLPAAVVKPTVPPPSQARVQPRNAPPSWENALRSNCNAPMPRVSPRIIAKQQDLPDLVPRPSPRVSPHIVSTQDLPDLSSPKFDSHAEKHELAVLARITDADSDSSDCDELTHDLDSDALDCNHAESESQGSDRCR